MGMFLENLGSQRRSPSLVPSIIRVGYYPYTLELDTLYPYTLKLDIMYPYTLKTLALQRLNWDHGPSTKLSR